MTEEWRPIVGFEGEYEVSNLGEVRSLDRETNRGGGGRKWIKGKVLKPLPHPLGYTNCCLRGRHWKTVHRIVAVAFLENPNDYRCVNHKNGVKSDNRVENLEWCSHGQNSKHAYESGIRVVTESQRSSLKRRS